jgi:hypothetical protein
VSKLFYLPDSPPKSGTIDSARAAALSVTGGAVTAQELSVDVPTRLDAFGRLSRPNDSPPAANPAVASIVVLSAAPQQLSLVTHSNARVVVGARRVNGATLLADRDRIFIGARELVVGLDALPVRRESPHGSHCGVCDRGADESAGVEFACPRCGLRACERCWGEFRNEVCLTSLCSQPSAFDRLLWTPAPADFLDYRET